eukprot:jgi/Orpsp1_1/1181961/evm.model.c7180000079269.1
MNDKNNPVDNIISNFYKEVEDKHLYCLLNRNVIMKKIIEFAKSYDWDTYTKHIFNHYFYNTVYVLELLHNYKNKQVLSDDELDKIRLVLNIDINDVDKNENTLLFTMCSFDNVKAVKYLIEKGADVNKKCNDGNTPLINACNHNNFEVIKCLVENGANIDQRNNKKISPLSIVYYNNDIFKYLIDKGADININYSLDYTLLANACIDDDISMVKFLVENGADVNKISDGGYAPLVMAIENSNEEIIRYLIENGADVDIEDSEGYTPLIAASENNMIECIEILLDNGADINKKNKNGISPLKTACDNCTVENDYDILPKCVEYLLDHGATKDEDFYDYIDREEDICAQRWNIGEFDFAGFSPYKRPY